jgi:hypothetical protein
VSLKDVLRGPLGYAALGIVAAALQTTFQLQFAAPLEESLHEKIAAAGAEEEAAYWAMYAAAALYGASLGVIFHFITRRVEPARAAILMFVGYSLMPTLKWLPTPHGISYEEPVWWREAVYALYLLYNVLALLLVRPANFLSLRTATAAALLALGFVAFPSFTIPERYRDLLPELRALQGLSLASWGLFWLVMSAGARALMPIKKRL